MIHRILLVLLAIAATAASPDVNDPPFRRLTVLDGLSQNSVYAIVQDRQGFMWIATQDGLNRYDGYQFEVFKHDPDEPNSLSGNSISSVYQDTDGMLWVGTHKNGLNRFDPIHQTFRHYRTDADAPGSLPSETVTAISEDLEGRLWVGTAGGLARLDERTDLFSVYKHDGERRGTIGSDIVTSLEIDGAGTLWAGTWGGGLNRFDPDNDSFETHRVDASNPRGLLSDNVTAIHEDRSGVLWVGTAGGGLSRFNRLTETFDHYLKEHDNPSSLSSNEVSSIYEDGSGSLWVGTWSGGLNRLDPKRITFSHFTAGAGGRSGLGDNRIHAITEDRSGVIWIGTGLGGISQLDRHQATFEHILHDPSDPNSLSDNTVWAVHEGVGGIVWIGTNSGGLNRLDRSTGRFTHFRHDAESSNPIGSNLVRAIQESRDGSIWLGTGAGLEILDPGTGRVKRVPSSDSDPGSLPAAFVQVLLEDHSGVMWIGTSKGLSRYERASRTFVDVPKDASAGDLADVPVLAILESRSGDDLWIGTTQGLHRLNRETEDLISYRHDEGDPSSLSNDRVYGIYEDSDGVIWVGTFGGGLNRLDPSTGTFRRWTEQNSELPTNTVFGILADEAGYLWLSTHRGLTRFDPRTETFRVFGQRRGVQSPEFNSGASHLGQYSGDLYFGGINGLNIVRPGAMRDNPTPPDVAVTEFRLRSDGPRTSVDRGSGAGFAENATIVLDHDQNDFWVDYVAFHYALPAANQYAYMLENYDDGWRYVGTLREAAYTNLDPGDYVFRVKAASVDGVWNDVGASLPIRIRPPWWDTPWAYATYGLIFILGVFAVGRLQRRRLIKQERARSEIREAQLRARALELENERQTRELEEARDLQLSMLPRSVPEHPFVEIEAFMRTATEVGGDYYDFYVAPDDTLTIVVGDATDHGARAGTMVTAVKSLFNVLAEEDRLSTLVERATRAIKRMQFGRLFMALAVARINGRELRLAGAGMPAALVLRADSGKLEEIPLKGMPLGSLVDYPYTESSVRLNPGDTVLLMSDGFAERFNEDRELFGYRNAVAAFHETRGMSPADVIKHLVSVSDTWAGSTGSTDDMTFVVMKAKGEIS